MIYWVVLLALMTGLQIIDKIIEKDEIVEFYSIDEKLLYSFYHRVIVLSSPVNVIIVGERGGIDPLLIERFRRIFEKDDEIFIRRAFKVEDVKPTIDAMGEGDLIVVNPYHHGKNYTEIVGTIRMKVFNERRTGKKIFVFSNVDRRTKGSIFGLHSAHSVIELKSTNRGFIAKIVKSVITKEVEIPYGFWDIYGKYDDGLMKWLL